MSHVIRRMTAGSAVLACTALGAGPALANQDPGAGYDAEIAYTCGSDRGHEDTVTLYWYIKAETDDGWAEVGDTLEHGTVIDGLTYWVGHQGVPVTSLTYTGTVHTEGEAAEREEERFEATWSGSAEEPFQETEGWDDEGLFRERELTRAGSLSYRPAEVTVELEQEDGTHVTTTCTPDSTPTPVLAEVDVDERDSGDDGDGGEEAQGDDDAKPASDGGSGAGGLPVTGTLLGGAAVVAGVAVVGGGGAAVYFSRKKKAAAHGDAEV